MSSDYLLQDNLTFLRIKERVEIKEFQSIFFPSAVAQMKALLQKLSQYSIDVAFVIRFCCP